MNQNDISKRHQNDTLDIQGLFGNVHDKTLYACAQKLGKVGAAVHLVADIIESDKALAEGLHNQSLVTIRSGYASIGKQHMNADMVMDTIMKIDELTALVDIGCIARSVSRMNTDIIRGELIKVRDVLLDLIITIRKTEQSFILSQYAVNQPVIQTEVVGDVLFESVLRDYQSKRHQNDIKTTLIAQNDIQNDNSKIKTTPVIDIPRVGRQKDILNLIKSSNTTTLAVLRMKIPDCSEKTLQRELAILLDMGLIRKEGNKRWTTYRSV